MIIRVIAEPITRAEAKEIAREFYIEMVKGVVDIERELLALGGEWHTDANAKLIEYGSKPVNIWGFNFYPDQNRIEYTSLINIRPDQHNRKIEIQDEALKRKIEQVIRKLII